MTTISSQEMLKPVKPPGYNVYSDHKAVIVTTSPFQRVQIRLEEVNCITFYYKLDKHTTYTIIGINNLVQTHKTL